MTTITTTDLKHAIMGAFNYGESDMLLDALQRMIEVADQVDPEYEELEFQVKSLVTEVKYLIIAEERREIWREKYRAESAEDCCAGKVAFERKGKTHREDPF